MVQVPEGQAVAWQADVAVGDHMAVVSPRTGQPVQLVRVTAPLIKHDGLDVFRIGVQFLAVAMQPGTGHLLDPVVTAATDLSPSTLRTFSMGRSLLRRWDTALDALPEGQVWGWAPGAAPGAP